MAEKELYDYLSSASADVDVTLSVDPQKVIIEEIDWNQTVLEGDDESEVVISHSSSPIAYVTLEWAAITPSDAGTILDIWADSAKAKGRANSFKCDSIDDHTYVVKFRDKLDRNVFPVNYMGIAKLRLKVLGYI